MEQQIREYVQTLLKMKAVKGFFGTHVQKQTNAPIEQVQKVLVQMVEEGLLTKQYELLCNKHNCMTVLDKQTSLERLSSFYDCELCGEETENVNPTILLRFLIPPK